jgi:hypothetical protein
MPETSSAPRAQQSDPRADGLTHLSLRELLQRLAACEEALRVPAGAGGDGSLSVVAGPGTRGARPPGADPQGRGARQDVLHAQAAISKELQRRRHLRHPRQHGGERRRSAAWPPPPW